MTLPLIFVATGPDTKNNQLKNPPYLEELFARKDLAIVHQGFVYESKVGQKALDNLKDTKIPKTDHHWETVVLKDIFAIKQADAVVYDLDKDPGPAYLMAAVIFKKPIIAISNELASAPVYFSGHIQAVIKSGDLLEFLQHKKILKKSKKKDNETDILADKQKAIQDEINENVDKELIADLKKSPTFDATKDHIEKVLHTELSKQANQAKQGVNLESIS